jgi:hypothetical protein
VIRLFNVYSTRKVIFLVSRISFSIAPAHIYVLFKTVLGILRADCTNAGLFNRLLKMTSFSSIALTGQIAELRHFEQTVMLTSVGAINP